ncbi:rhodanese-like domain-containing protein [Emticicia sp. BO119]|uniref:rhodanese-like domain-containing protein n=1 Tax=Emticicia sp. BO119 TaxID=2757768 RepID=UPI0015F05576|nr:rhodanese-like domain-containing protein [Emticicia sp. BO119]MBA4848848.1 rhodanese-like domain-containing protein [Emticicia sp. BO119]
MDKNFDITAGQLKEMLDSEQPINLIDVREDYEYEEDNLGGQLIPLGEIPDRLEELEELKGQPIYIHCRSGARSGRAKEFLISNGFDDVHNVLGGILAYRELEK